MKLSAGFPHFALLISCLSIVGYGELCAQDAPPVRLGIGYTGTAYRGDFTAESGAIWRAEPGINFSVDVDKQKPLRLQLNIGTGGFTEQADSPLPLAPEGINPNTFVRTTFFYTDLKLVYRFFVQQPVRPYLGVGAGLFSFQPRDEAGNFLGENIFSRLPEEEYLTLIGSIPVSAGVEWKISSSVGLGLEYTYRMTGSDYLDNISQLGTASGNDKLHSLQLKLLVSLGQNSSPNEMNRPTLPIIIDEPVAEEVPSPVYYRHKDGRLRER
ncbi:MAG: porin family protein [Bacteroidia bacterium]|nr:porin family protein [Bacteroidia bacterium]